MGWPGAQTRALPRRALVLAHRAEVRAIPGQRDATEPSVAHRGRPPRQMLTGSTARVRPHARTPCPVSSPPRPVPASYCAPNAYRARFLLHPAHAPCTQRARRLPHARSSRDAAFVAAAYAMAFLTQPVSQHRRADAYRTPARCARSARRLHRPCAMLLWTLRSHALVNTLLQAARCFVLCRRLRCGGTIHLMQPAFDPAESVATLPDAPASNRRADDQHRRSLQQRTSSAPLIVLPANVQRARPVP